MLVHLEPGEWRWNIRPRIMPRRAREPVRKEGHSIIGQHLKKRQPLVASTAPLWSGSFPLTASACARYKRGTGESWHRTDILCTMNARMVFPLVLLVAAAAAPLASGQLSPEFYKTTCPDAEKIIFGIVENRFKEDPGTAAGLLRLVFHDCFANVTRRPIYHPTDALISQFVTCIYATCHGRLPALDASILVVSRAATRRS